MEIKRRKDGHTSQLQTAPMSISFLNLVLE